MIVKQSATMFWRNHTWRAFLKPRRFAQDVWMSINPTYESGDVNCLVALSESIFVAGSMDGSLRFFHADQGGWIATEAVVPTPNYIIEAFPSPNWIMGKSDLTTPGWEMVKNTYGFPVVPVKMFPFWASPERSESLWSLLKPPAGQAWVVRRHSQASGPVLALHFLRRADVLW